MKAYIKHISSYLPLKKVSNDDFFNRFPYLKSKQNIFLKTGVHNRYVVEPEETSSDLSYHAANNLFSEFIFDKTELDALIFCSTEFDYYTPITAAILQDRLGLSNHVATFDLVSSCTGFVHGITFSKGLIEANGYRNVLLLCASSSTKTFHEKDANSHYLFGDAATAILIGGRREEGVGKITIGTDGSRKDYIIVKDGGGRNKLTPESYKEIENEFGNSTARANFFMNGTGIFLFGLKTVPTLVEQILSENKINKDEVDYFVFHQANAFLLKTLQKKLNIPDEKFIIFMENTGNTVAASIPLALQHLFYQKKIQKGSKILIAAFGTGLTWGGTIISY